MKYIFYSSCLKKYFLFSLLLISAIPLLSQKVLVNLERSEECSLSLWRITNSEGTEVISVNDYLNEDSVSFSLEAEKLYSLRIIIPETGFPFSLNYSLGINGENILHISDRLPEGEYEYQFFTGIKTPDSKIIGGTNADISAFPWQVYYISGGYQCGGVIIAPGWILTAAHCTEDTAHVPIPASEMYIKAATSEPLKSTQGIKRYISEVIRHEYYDHSSFENDIALLKLEAPLNDWDARPIKLVSYIDKTDGAIAPGVMAWVTGWGLTRVSPPVVATYLQKVQLPIVSREQASLVWSSIPFSCLTAGYKNGTKDACNGDSGGPLIVGVTGEYKLAGIVSWGNKTCNTYGGYTRVTDFMDWIEQKTGIVDYRPEIPYGEKIVCDPADTGQYYIEPITGATDYDWKLYPSNTGTIAGDSARAEVYWNQLFTGQAQVMVRATIDNQISDWSKLKVNVAPERKILSFSNDTMICENQPMRLSVDAEGYQLKYQWFKNNSSLNSETSDFLSIQFLKPGNSGIYKCKVSNPCGTSSTDNIDIFVPPATKITNITPDVSIHLGSDVSLEVSSEGHNLSYQWQKDGKLIDGAENQVLRFNEISTRDIGIYNVSLSGTCGNLKSDDIYVYASNKEFSGPDDVFVWPTLLSDELNIAVNTDVGFTVRIYNLMGSLIREMRNCRYHISLNTGNLNSGYYLVSVFNNSFRKSVKVVKR